jgi:very-short-patch-repair endonuclease
MHKSMQTQRARNLRKNSTKVLRFWNHDVFQQTSSIFEVIMKALGPSEIKSREAAQI